MTTEDGQLVIWLCLDDLTSCQVMLSQIAAGDVFGRNQPLQLYIQGVDKGQIDDLCLDIQDCAYPLVRGCNALLDTSTVPAPHLVMVILSSGGHQGNSGVTGSLFSSLTRLVSYVHGLTEILSTKEMDKTYITVTGDMSMIAAKLLSDCLQVTTTRVIALDTESDHQKKGHFTGHLGQVQRMCHRIKQWWTGCQREPRVFLGTRFTDLEKSRETGYFFSAPVKIQGPQRYQLSQDLKLQTRYVSYIKTKSDLAEVMMRSMSRPQSEPEATAEVVLARL